MEFDFLLPCNGAKENTNIGPHHSIDLKDETMIKHAPLLTYTYDQNLNNNNRMYSRIFPTQNLNNAIEPRYTSKNVCTIDLRKKDKKDEQNVKETERKVADATNEYKEGSCNREFKQVQLSSGRLDADGYFSNIDIESRLKNIDYKDNLCYVKDYKKCSDIKAHPEIINKDYRIPVTNTNINYKCQFQIPEKCDTPRHYYLGQFDESDHTVCETFFNNNTRSKTLKQW